MTAPDELPEDADLDVADAEEAPRVSKPVARVGSTHLLDRHRLVIAIGILIIAGAVDLLAVVGWLLGKDIDAVVPFASTVTALAGTVLAFYFATPRAS